jgi:Uncharacterised nucleotidyltransferase
MIVTEIERHLTEYSRIRSESKVKFEKLRAVLSQMQKEGIDGILLKGADLIPRVYGVLGARPLGDADLLVHERDLAALDRLLRRLGYRPVIDGNPAYMDPDHTLALDIVTTVWYADDQNALWQRAVRRELQGIPVRGLGVNDLIVYLVAYTVVHRGCLSPQFGRDIALVLAKEEVDWDVVVEEASRCHLKVPIYHGLSFASTNYTGVAVPGRALSRLAPSTVGERLWYRFFARVVTDKPLAELGHLLLLITRPGSKKWRWLRDAFLPSPAFLRYRYGELGVLHPVRTRLRRGVSLFVRAQVLLAKVAARLVTRP